MKSNTVAPAERISSQNPDAENRSPIAAVVASSIAGTTVSTVASMWNIGNGQYSTSSCRSFRFSIISSA